MKIVHLHFINVNIFLCSVVGVCIIFLTFQHQRRWRKESQFFLDIIAILKMVVEQSNIDHIMRGLQSTEGVRLHNHRKKLRQRFDIIKKLGQGTYGKVQLGINKETGQEVAIKAIKKCKIETDADLVRIRREIQIMSSVRHPNIIHIYEVFENREKMVLVMEYAAGGELYDFLSERKVLEEPEARRIFRQISTAVYYCHKHKICHRDLKLENILLDENGNAKIADFGLSNVYDDQRLLNSFCGSPLYASPEIVKGTPYHGPEVDCWSLGVLLYTLVYGAMPFDGSNFKRLVKQISQGVYFEPKNASSASPLIREMLTVNPQKRATIEQICSHWWVNQGYNVSCLDIAEDLANQTPVRLDLLLSLAPPPENSEKLVVTDAEQSATSQDAPTRSLSVGSFMELDPNTEQRIREFVAQEVPSDAAAPEKTVKRKLEPDASESSIKKEGARKKERTKTCDRVKESEDAQKSANKEEKEEEEEEESASGAVMEVDPKASGKMDAEKADAEDAKTTDASAKPDEAKAEATTDEKPSEVVAKDKPTRKSVKVVKKKVVKDGEEAEKKEDVESVDSKVKVKKKKKETEAPPVTAAEPEQKKEPPKAEEKEEVGKEIKRDATVQKKSAGGVKTAPKEEKAKEKEKEKEKETPAPPLPQSEEPPPKIGTERRKSKIFETAEKFMTNDPKSPSQDKPKKVFIPGVKVSDFAKAFERKSSLTSAPTPVKGSPSRKSISKEAPEKKPEEEVKAEVENSSQLPESPTKAPEEAEVPSEETPEERKMTEITDDKLKKLKDSARNIIANALVEEERKKVKKQILKPPVPKTKTPDAEGEAKKPLTLHIGKETATVRVHSPENTKFLFDAAGGAVAESSGENKENIEGAAKEPKKTSKVEITLKSNTLPRGASSKGEARKPEKSANFRTEVEQRVGDPHAAYATQRSEVAFPVSAAQRPVRSMSLEPDSRKKERIIPIQLEDGHREENEARDRVKDLGEARPKMPYTRTQSQRSASLSRQSTQDSDTECGPAVPGEAIKKSPREFIIPIAVEGGGYVTPRATSLEPSDTFASKRGIRPFGRKISSLWSDNGSEDESPFSSLQRHPSRDLEEPFRLHRLRSTRPARTSIERADSGSGSEEEEEEDDDGFEILTAENLFSTLLSRVRSLTQRLNVEGGIRPGFPSSRLANHFGPSERLFSNFHQPLHHTSHASIKYRTSVAKLSDRPEFGRSLSRDVENGFNRWSRGDELINSDSTRSASRDPRDESGGGRRKEKKSRRSASQARKAAEAEEKKKKEEEEVEEEEEVGNPKAYNRQVSDSELVEPRTRGRGPSQSPSPSPALHRTMSLKSDRGKRRGEKKSQKEFAESDGKDFYDILAEKYGITNVKRYDLSRSGSRRDRSEAEAEDKQQQPDVLPPIPPKGKKEEAEKCKTPSEKLAAVLSKLEGGGSGGGGGGSKKKGKASEAPPEELAIDKEKLAGLSPQALDLYEKTLALYQKKKKKKEEGKPAKSGIPKKTTTTTNRRGSDAEEGRRETPEKSVLSKYLRGLDGSATSRSDTDLKSSEECFKDKKLKHYGSLRVKKEKDEEEGGGGEGKAARRKDGEERKSMVRRLSKELENGGEDKSKSKLLTTLERKFEKLRGEKKYVDKAIRSLRESSLGPKGDVASENELIKRAVSMSDCSATKAPAPSRIQSTVNSVLGMFKRIEKTDAEDARTRRGSDAERRKLSLKVDVSNRATRRPSYVSNSFICRNDASLNKSPSSVLGVDDSSSLKSPDSESFDSWSNCSDLGSPEDVSYRSRHSASNFDEMSTESVGERIRRKSFYTRFNERKKPRRSSILDERRKYADAADARQFEKSPSSTSVANQSARKLYDDARPRPFYKTSASVDASPASTLDWPSAARSPTFARSNSHASSISGYATLSRSYVDGGGGLEGSRIARLSSLYRNRDADVSPAAPVRTFTPARALSPSVSNRDD